jgi:hypothetical protein
MTKKILKPILISAVILSLIWILLFRGCVESDFLLSKESRLPKWMQLPSGYNRSDVNVSLFLYNFSKARFIVRGSEPERTKLIDVLVKAEWHEATRREANRRGSFVFRPHYYHVSYKGIDDIIEFPCEGPVFWMADSVDTNTSSTTKECPPIDDRLIGNPW